MTQALLLLEWLLGLPPLTWGVVVACSLSCGVIGAVYSIHLAGSAGAVQGRKS